MISLVGVWAEFQVSFSALKTNSCFGRKPLVTTGTGFYGTDVLPVNQNKAPILASCFLHSPPNYRWKGHCFLHASFPMLVGDMSP